MNFRRSVGAAPTTAACTRLARSKEPAPSRPSSGPVVASSETLPVAEFLRRYLQHVPPPHYQTVRHYGLYTSAKKRAHACCCALLADRQPPYPLSVSEDDQTDDAVWIQQHTCPVCGQPLIVSGYLPSSVTGRIIPRLPLGHIVARPPTDGGGP